ncbi:hypothetical protein Taro_055076 [Colocasia esculenta]|uniref:Uncharacterized protein n=1 Tax=Colocasia esculenta TaxID=4460 RepID=A0A843XQI7_COLES|nr:hypothetical protein [Colocasia esculenta]
MARIRRTDRQNAAEDFLLQHSLDGTQSSGGQMLVPYLGMLGHPCCFLAFWDIAGHFLAFSDVPAVFCLYGTFLSFGFPGHPGRFLTLWDVPVIW